MGSYKFETTIGLSIGELWAQRADREDRKIAIKRQTEKGYTLCAQSISDKEYAYWYEPNGSSNADELGQALVAVNKLALRYGY